MEVLIFKETENIIRNISVSGVKDILGSDKYTQRVVTTKAGYRICVLYNEKASGGKKKIKLQNGETIIIKGTCIIVHDEYGAYGNILLEDIGDIMLAVEEA